MITYKQLFESGEVHHAMAFGRMNPITSGHEAVVKKLHDVSKEHGASHSIVVSNSQDAKKNPLSAEQKVQHAKTAFPKTNVTAASKEAPTILHHAAAAHKAGATHLHVVAGSDRHEEMHNLLHKYNNKEAAHGHYNFKKITVHSSGERDPDAEGTTGMSASKMREHAASGNKTEFHKGAPSTMKPKHKDAMYNDVRKGMNIKEETIDQQDDRVKQLKRFKDQVKTSPITEEDSYLKQLIGRMRKGEKLDTLQAALVRGHVSRSKKYTKHKNEINIDEETLHEGHYEDAQAHMDLASKALETSDMAAHHAHMADHHDSLSQWHDSKGRASAAQKHADKAEEHADKYTKHALGRSVSEGAIQPNGTDKIETSTAAPTNSTAKDTTMGKKVKGFKFFHGEGERIAEAALAQKGVNVDKVNTAGQTPHEEKFETVKKKLVKEEDLSEVISKKAPAAEWIKDFISSDNPKFAGKSKDKRKQMALAAYYSKQRNEEVELDEKVVMNKTTGETFGTADKPVVKPTAPAAAPAKPQSALERVRARMAASKTVKEGMNRQDRERAANEQERRAAAIANNPRIAAEVERRRKAAEAAKAEVKEEVEELDELSKATLTSYADKASESARTMPGYGTKAEGSKKTNRLANIAVAMKRKQSVCEEVEELDEKISTAQMGHAGKTTIKHIKNPTVQQRMAAHDVKSYKDRIDLLKAAQAQGNLKEEELDEKSDQAKQNKTMKNMMDASRGARFKINNPQSMTPKPDTGHKTPRAHNVAIGRALRNEEALDETTTGNPEKGYHGAVQSPEDKYKETHSHVKNLTDGDDKTVKHYLDSTHGRHLAGREQDHEYIKKDFKKFKKYYNPEMHESITTKEENMKSYKEFVMMLEYEAKDGVYQHKGTYGGSYVDPEGADETKSDMKKPAKAAGRKSGQSVGSYKPRKTLSKLRQA